MWLALTSPSPPPPPLCPPLPLPLPFLITLHLPLPLLLWLSQACQVSSNPQRTRQASQGGLHRLCARPPGSPNPESPGWRKARKSAPSALRWALMRDSQISETLTYTPTCTHINTSRRRHNTCDKILQTWGLVCLQPSLINTDTSTLTGFTLSKRTHHTHNELPCYWASHQLFSFPSETRQASLLFNLLPSWFI